MTKFLKGQLWHGKRRKILRNLEISEINRIFASEILKIEGMCKYNIAIDDAVMEVVRPSITSGMDEDAWVQLQVEALFSRIAASRRKVSFDDEYMTNLINLSAPAWEDMNYWKIQVLSL